MTDKRMCQLELAGFAAVVVVMWAAVITCAVLVLA